MLKGYMFRERLGALGLEQKPVVDQRFIFLRHLQLLSKSDVFQFTFKIDRAYLWRFSIRWYLPITIHPPPTHPVRVGQNPTIEIKDKQAAIYPKRDLYLWHARMGKDGLLWPLVVAHHKKLNAERLWRINRTCVVTSAPYDVCCNGCLLKDIYTDSLTWNKAV